MWRRRLKGRAYQRLPCPLLELAAAPGRRAEERNSQPKEATGLQRLDLRETERSPSPCRSKEGVEVEPELTEAGIWSWPFRASGRAV